MITIYVANFSNGTLQSTLRCSLNAFSKSPFLTMNGHLVTVINYAEWKKEM